MGKLSGHNYEVTAITFRIRAQATGARFTVPKAIAEELDSGDDRRIGVTVRSGAQQLFDGEVRLVFDGDVRLASGTEAYYRVSDVDTAGLEDIGSHEELEVTVRRPKAT